MKRIVSLFALALVTALFSLNALAQNANPCPGDKAYQVNIIGVPKNKSAPMDNNSGHRIFVPLGSKTEAVSRKVQIYMTGDTDPDTDGLQCGNDFRVLDANATNDDEATLLVPCDPIADGYPGICFDVFATGLGTPGGKAEIDVVCEFTDLCVGCDTEDKFCYTDAVDFDVERGKNKPVTENITSVFRASGCIDGIPDNGDCGTQPEDLVFSNVWIFNIPELITYYWDYDNKGLKLMQLRFCDSAACGSVVAGGS